jgi:TonB family protein
MAYLRMNLIIRFITFIEILIAINCKLFALGGAYPEFFIKDGKAFLQNKSVIFCVNLSTKQLIWKYQPRLHILLPDSVQDFNFTGIDNFNISGNKLFLGTNEGWLLVMSQSDGSLISEYCLKNRILTLPIINYDKLYFGGVNNSLYCYDLNMKDTLWSYHTFGEITNSLLLYNNYLCFGSKDKYFYAVDTSNGKYKWKKEAYSSLKTCPVLYNGHIFIGSDDGTIYNVDPDNGGEYWHSMNGTNFGEDVFPVIVYDDVIYKHTTEGLVSANIKRLEGRFLFEGGNISPKTVLARDSALYYVGDSILYSANAVSGIRYQSVNLKDTNISVPIIEGSYYYYLAGNKLKRLNLDDSSIETIFDFNCLNNDENEKVVTASQENLNETFKNISYPEEARTKNIEGKVIIRCLIDESGNKLCKYVEYSDNDLLAEEALSAVNKTNYSPQEINGIKVKIWLEISVIFGLK